MDLWECLSRAALGTGFIFLMTVLGAAVVLLAPESEEPGAGKAFLGFSGGVMTAATVWSLLLPAMERTAALGLPLWLPAAAGIVLGAAFLAGLDGLLLHRSGAEGVDPQDALLIAAITLHNIPEGMAVGLAFAMSSDGEGLAAAAALALGIGIQNFPEGTAVALPLLRSGRRKGVAFRTGALSGAVEPVFGMLAALAAAWATMLMPWLLGFAAGAMLYVVVEELVPQARSRAGTVGFLAGFLLMMILDVALG